MVCCEAQGVSLSGAAAGADLGGSSIQLYLVGFINRSRTCEGRFPRPLHMDVG